MAVQGACALDSRRASFARRAARPSARLKTTSRPSTVVWTVTIARARAPDEPSPPPARPRRRRRGVADDPAPPRALRVRASPLLVPPAARGDRRGAGPHPASAPRRGHPLARRPLAPGRHPRRRRAVHGRFPLQRRARPRSPSLRATPRALLLLLRRRRLVVRPRDPRAGPSPVPLPADVRSSPRAVPPPRVHRAGGALRGPARRRRIPRRARLPGPFPPVPDRPRRLARRLQARAPRPRVLRPKSRTASREWQRAEAEALQAQFVVHHFHALCGLLVEDEAKIGTGGQGGCLLELTPREADRLAFLFQTNAGIAFAEGTRVPSRKTQTAT